MTQARISTAESGPPPIDEKVLADLIASIGVDATDAQIEIFDLFFESAPQLMAKVNHAADLGAWDALRADLHALRGSCELFGATQLAQLCKDLEKSIASGEVAHARTKTEEIETELNRVVGYLRDKRPADANPVTAGLEMGQPIVGRRSGAAAEES